MQCPRCGGDNPEGMRFCIECAAPLTRRCPQCDFVNPPQAKFCGQCAASLSGPLPAAASPPHAPYSHTPISYTPAHLAEKILTSRSALAEERKQVTVLFADLKGSMELLADRDPEEARRLLDPVLERMMAAVHRYEGTVNQVMGDGIMALFGAPIAHEDHAVRACYAALAMQEAIRRDSENVRRTHGIEVQIRVGLNSGEVVVRSIGNDLHMDYSAIGQTTHLAARMEQLASPGSILLTMETLRLAEGLIQVKPLGSTPVKGLSHPVEIFELAGAGPTRTRLQAFAARELTRFVGRQAELEDIHHALEQAGASRGQLVAVIGEPGVGKTRLFYEFICSHRTHGWLLLEGYAVSYSKATPYLRVRDLLKAYFQIEAQDDGVQMREKVTGKLLALDAALRPTLPALLALLDIPVEDRDWQALDPPQRRQRTLDAMKRLLLQESQIQPLLVVCENLHWIDTETQAFLDSLVESLPTTRILLLVNYRPEYQHSWGSKTYYTQLRLDPLPPASAEAFLQALLGDDASLAPLKRLLIERTEGNPFFLEESVRTLVETGVLAWESGTYRVAKPLASLQVPATVQAVLAARIDRLPPEEKRLLQTAAVIGTEVPFPVLQAIAELPEADLYRGLAHLQAAEFLYETRLFPEREFTFKHALTHEVAYSGLLLERRRVLHARIVEALEQLYAERLGDDQRLGRIACYLCIYFSAMGEYDRALAAGQRALAQATISAAFDVQVVAQTYLGLVYHEVGDFRQALDVSQRVMASLTGELRYVRFGQIAPPAVMSRYHVAWSLAELGGFAEGSGVAEDTVRLAEAVEHPNSIGSALRGVGLLYRRQGDVHKAIPRLERSLALSQHALLFLPVAASLLGAAYALAGRAAEALPLLEQMLERVASGSRMFAYAHVLTELSEALLLVGRVDEASALAGRLLELSRTHTGRGYQAHAYRLLGDVAMRREPPDVDQAEAHYRQALALAEELGMRPLQAHCHLGLGKLYAKTGRWERAQSELAAAIELYRAMEMTFWLPQAEAVLAQVEGR